jgi:transcriptional regulator with XRE-family HTH domain
MLTKGLEGASSTEVKEIKLQIKRIGLAIQEYRMKSKLTQEVLAEELNCSVNTIKYIEQGRRIPSLPMLLRICKKIGLKFELNSSSF